MLALEEGKNASKRLLSKMKEEHQEQKQVPQVGNMQQQEQIQNEVDKQQQAAQELEEEIIGPDGPKTPPHPSSATLAGLSNAVWHQERRRQFARLTSTTAACLVWINNSDIRYIESRDSESIGRKFPGAYLCSRRFGSLNFQTGCSRKRLRGMLKIITCTCVQKRLTQSKFISQSSFENKRLISSSAQIGSGN